MPITKEASGFNLIFFGTPDFSLPAIIALKTAGYKLLGVVTAPDRLVGRQQILQACPAKKLALEFQFPVWSPQTLHQTEFYEEFKKLKPDIGIVVAYNQLIPDDYLTVPKLGFLNIHPSLLPAYRGPSPIQSALLDGRTTTGISIIKLDSKLDHGPIIAQVDWPIPTTADYRFCSERLAAVGADLLLQILMDYTHGKVSLLPQDDSRASYTQKFKRHHGRINWHESANNINNLIRALSFNPGTWTFWDEKTLNILKAHPVATSSSLKPGQVFQQSNETLVACGSGSLVIEIVQLAGSRVLSINSFVNGHRGFLKSCLQ